MAKMATNEVFDKFYESTEGTKDGKQRYLLKESQIYAYEQKIGKQIFDDDMDIEDFYGLFETFDTKKDGTDVGFIANYSLDKILSLFRKIFDFYIDNVETIKNPFHNKIKSAELAKRLAKGKEPFTWKTVENVIKKLHTDLPDNRADYIELIMLLYYNGFETAEEIIKVTENEINHNNMTVSLPGRTIQLSERCYSLFVKFNRMTEVSGWRDFVLVSWHNSYFKFAIRANNADTIDDRPLSAMRDRINVLIAKHVNIPYQTKINYRNLYLLGFYNFLVGKFGAEETDRMLVSYRNSNDVRELMMAAREYGFKADHISHFKRRLRPFIKAEE